MKITTKELSEKIVNHIINDLEKLFKLGNVNSIIKSNYGKKVMNKWPKVIEQIIIRGSRDETYVAFFDGSSKPNPGKIKIGGYVRDNDGNDINRYSLDLGEGTNNEAEYKSFLHLLDMLIEEQINDVEIFGDSKLVVNQVNKVWKAKDERMIILRDMALQKLEKIPSWKLTHVLRDKNKKADILTQ